MQLESQRRCGGKYFKNNWQSFSKFSEKNSIVPKYSMDFSQEKQKEKPHEGIPQSNCGKPIMSKTFKCSHKRILAL
jgi:hypothetical protein